MIPRLLACLLGQVVAMGLVHLLLSRRANYPHVAFVAVSGLAGLALGLAAFGPSLAAHARLSAWTLAWFPAFALGFFSTGVVLGLAWLVLVRGGEMWLRRRLGRGSA